MTRAFKVTVNNDEIEVNFQKKADLKAIRQIEFSSRLLYGFIPDVNNVWKPGKRTDYFIMGFPPEIKWECTGETTLHGKAVPGFKLDSAYVDELTNAISGLCDASGWHNAKYKFRVTNRIETLDYEFHSRARTICALAVLYDLEWHPRKDLEIWINPDFTDKLPPGQKPDLVLPEEQYYGDPSKTADVLRNEGWSREATSPYMYVEARQVGRQSQQHYRITQIAQPIDNQVMRTNIKPQWRNSLFSAQNFICQICLTSYDGATEQLSPDHRIPVVFQPDNLTDSNYMEKLMTLCRFCNQAKREFTKRLKFDYDWNSSPWAYPEKFRMEIVLQQIHAMANTKNVAVSEVLHEISAQLDKSFE